VTKDGEGGRKVERGSKQAGVGRESSDEHENTLATRGNVPERTQEVQVMLVAKMGPELVGRKGGSKRKEEFSFRSNSSPPSLLARLTSNDRSGRSRNEDGLVQPETRNPR